MYKKNKFCLSAMVLAAILSFPTTISSLAAVDPANAWKKQNDGSYLMYDGSSLNGVIARGIDVSKWQGTIDWTKASKDDIQFVMIGTKAKTGLDEQFHANAKNAAQNGVKLGAYIYSRATNTTEAIKEADFVLNLVKDYPISYPIAYDIEDDATQGSLSKSQLTQIIDTFCNKIKAAGYYPIIYANDYWISNKFDSNIPKKYPIWVARYNIKHTFATPVMWQASSTAKVAGIQGDVDIDFQYKSFEGKTLATTWRNIGGKQYYYKNYQPQKNTWVFDQNKWYYLGSSGTKLTGWIATGNKKYYLDSSGVMKTGWIKDANSWYYANASGAMVTGWVKDKNLWYYMLKNGKMKTGWVNDGKNYYYLSSSGAMKTGWIKDGRNWYYLDASGAMRSGWYMVGGLWYFMDNSGKMLTGAIKSNGKVYYLANDGHMLSNTMVTLNGAQYYANASGALSGYSGNALLVSTGGGHVKSASIHIDDTTTTGGADNAFQVDTATAQTNDTTSTQSTTTANTTEDNNTQESSTQASTSTEQATDDTSSAQTNTESESSTSVISGPGSDIITSTSAATGYNGGAYTDDASHGPGIKK